MAYLRQVVPGMSLIGLGSMVVHVGFMRDKVMLGQLKVQILWFVPFAYLAFNPACLYTSRGFYNCLCYQGTQFHQLAMSSSYS